MQRDDELIRIEKNKMDEPAFLKGAEVKILLSTTYANRLFLECHHSNISGIEEPFRRCVYAGYGFPKKSRCPNMEVEGFRLENRKKHTLCKEARR